MFRFHIIFRLFAAFASFILPIRYSDIIFVFFECFSFMSQVGLGRLYLRSSYRSALSSICDVSCARISAKMAGCGEVNGGKQYYTKIQNGVRRY